MESSTSLAWRGSSRSINLKYKLSKSALPWCNTEPLANNNSELNDFTIWNPVDEYLVLYSSSLCFTHNLKNICLFARLNYTIIKPWSWFIKNHNYWIVYDFNTNRTIRLSPPDIPWTRSSPILIPMTWSSLSSWISGLTLEYSCCWGSYSLDLALTFMVSSTVSEGNKVSLSSISW